MEIDSKLRDKRKAGSTAETKDATRSAAVNLSQDPCDSCW